MRGEVQQNIASSGKLAVLDQAAPELAEFPSEKNYEKELARLSRLYTTLSQVTHTIMWAASREEMFEKVCRVLVEKGAFHMGWIGRFDRMTHEITPVVSFGKDPDFLQAVRIYGDDRPEGNGPTGRAFRTGQPCVCNDVHHDAATLPWRKQLAQRKFQACAGFPIRLRNEMWGALTVCADEAWFFQDKEVALLQETAENISFALSNFEDKAIHREAEKTAENERLFSATMIESMPGILYFYDEQGRFLRWNRNFEVISGYSHEEIARMHPLDFFPPEEKPFLAERIRDVFEKGESSAEALFIAKDGRAIPYYFTGRRVFLESQPCLVGMGVDISVRKQAEQRLAESERNYRELVQHANSIILRWDASGRVTFLNEFGQHFFGYFAEQIIGHSVLGTIMPITETSGRDLEQLMREFCADPDAFEQSINENVRWNGQRVWVSWTNRMVRDGEGNPIEILSVGVDITEQRLADQALRQSEEQFRLIMENLADLVAVLDLEGNRLYNSPSYEAILGAPDKLLGASSFEQVHPEDRNAVREVFAETVRTGIGQRMEYRMIDCRGQSRHIESQGSVIRDPRGAVSQVIVVSRDVTERREADNVIRDLNTNLERRVAERTVELEAALVRAEAADKLKSAFLATMSHELRTPLNSIIGFTGIVLQGMAGPINPEQKKQLGMVRSSARHLLELINDILDLSKIEAGQLEVRSESFSLNESIERVLASVEPIAQKRNLALISEIPPDLGEVVSDRRRIEQILLNLVNNAIKFTDRGSVRVTVERISDFMLSAAHGPVPAVSLHVLDTGIGIKSDDLQSLFQPFRQIDSGLARQHEGTGLGLAICRRLARLLGGEISARSIWGQGSEFTVTLPIGKPHS